jgi:hypothetical protein
MRKLFLLCLLLYFAVSAVTRAQAESLTCSVSLSDTQRVLTPRTAEGRSFSTFELDLNRDPQVWWMHQNYCVLARDFKRARFEGGLCMLVMTGAEISGPSAPLILSVDLNRNVATAGDALPTLIQQPWKESLSIRLPINTSSQSTWIRQTFATKGRKGELTALEISCSP